MRTKLSILASSLSLILFIGLTSVSAQIDLSTAQLGDSMTLTSAPEVPGPNTNVNLRLESFSTDLNRADIRWEVNGVVEARALGLTTFQLKTGEVGSSKTVKARAQTREGRVMTQTRTFSPGLVDIIWQADSWTPAFYRGFGLPVAKAKVTAQAIPHILVGKKLVSSRSLYYRWFYDFQPLIKQSGVGIDTINVEAPDLFGEKNLRVQVSTLDNKVVVDTQITLTPFQPFVLVWRNDALAGLDYNNPLGSIVTFEDEELGLEAGGIYFPTSHAKSPGLSYRWSVNGKPAVVDDQKPNTLAVRRIESGGEGQVNVDIEDPTDNIISASKAFTIKASPKSL